MTTNEFSYEPNSGPMYGKDDMFAAVEQPGTSEVGGCTAIDLKRRAVEDMTAGVIGFAPMPDTVEEMERQPPEQNAMWLRATTLDGVTHELMFHMGQIVGLRQLTLEMEISQMVDLLDTIDREKPYLSEITVTMREGLKKVAKLVDQLPSLSAQLERTLGEV